MAQPSSRTAKNFRIIGHETSLEDTISALADRGCSNLTPSIDLSSCSEYPLAGGGFCDVYRGVLQNGTQVAIKSLRVFDRPGQDDNRRKILKRAAKELYYWSRLTHRNVLPLLGLAIFRGQISMISEWMESGSLMSYVRLNGSADRLKLCRDTCAGLNYVHKVGMVHGDLKAANVMVSAAGDAVIADCGNSELRELTLKFTKTSSSTLTIRWAAPEILLQDSGPYASKEADVYAYGMTALETLTGNIPYKELNDQQVLRQVAYRNVHPVRPESGIANELWDILTSCWARIPSERPTIAVIKKLLRALSQKEGPSTSHFGPEGTFGENDGLEVLDKPSFPKSVNSPKLDPSDLATDLTHHNEPDEHGTNSSETGSLDTISDVFLWNEDDEDPGQAVAAAQTDESTSGEPNYNYAPEGLFQSVQTISLLESPDHHPSNLPEGWIPDTNDDGRISLPPAHEAHPSPLLINTNVGDTEISRHPIMPEPPFDPMVPRTPEHYGRPLSSISEASPERQFPPVLEAPTITGGRPEIGASPTPIRDGPTRIEAEPSRFPAAHQTIIPPSPPPIPSAYTSYSPQRWNEPSDPQRRADADDAALNAHLRALEQARKLQAGESDDEEEEEAVQRYIQSRYGDQSRQSYSHEEEDESGGESALGLSHQVPMAGRPTVVSNQNMNNTGAQVEAFQALRDQQDLERQRQWDVDHLTGDDNRPPFLQGSDRRRKSRAVSVVSTSDEDD